VGSGCRHTVCIPPASAQAFVNTFKTVCSNQVEKRVEEATAGETGGGGGGGGMDPELLETIKDDVLTPHRRALGTWLQSAAPSVVAWLKSVEADQDITMLEEGVPTLGGSVGAVLSCFVNSPPPEEVRDAVKAMVAAALPLLTPVKTNGDQQAGIADMVGNVIELGWMSSAETARVGEATYKALACAGKTDLPTAVLNPSATEALMKLAFIVAMKEPKMLADHAPLVVEALTRTYMLASMYWRLNDPEVFSAVKAANHCKSNNAMFEIVLGITAVLQAMGAAHETVAPASKRAIKAALTSKAKGVLETVFSIMHAAGSWLFWVRDEVVVPASKDDPPSPAADVKEFMDSDAAGTVVNAALRAVSGAEGVLSMYQGLLGPDALQRLFTPAMMSTLPVLGLARRVVPEMCILVIRNHVEPWRTGPLSVAGKAQLDAVARIARRLQELGAFPETEEQAGELVMGMMAADEEAGGPGGGPQPGEQPNDPNQ
jgi:hypothetical protein